MNNLNSILIEGNIVRDPLLRNTPKGTAVCTFTIACSRFYRDDTGLAKEVSFFDIETWSKLAESCYQRGKKGRALRVVGRLRQDRWQGADGKDHARIVVLAEHVEFRPEIKKDAETLPEEVGEDAYDIEQEVPPDDEIIDESKAVEVTAEETV